MDCLLLSNCFFHVGSNYDIRALCRLPVGCLRRKQFDDKIPVQELLQRDGPIKSKHGPFFVRD